MKSSKYHLAPNVIPGTNFNVDRFQELYSWIEACRADAMSLNLPAYGLLCNELGNPAFDLQVNGKVVQVNHCFAITSSGILLAVFPENSKTLELSLDEKLLREHPQLDIILVADLKGKRAGIGQANTSETPMRLPYSILPYRLEVQAPDYLNANGDYLKIGEIVSNNSVPVLSNYLPACAQAGAHPILWNQLTTYQQQLKDFYHAIKSIIKNIDSAKEDVVVVSFAKLCREMGTFLSSYIPKMKAFHAHRNPQEFFEMMTAFAERVDFEWQINSQHSELLELVQYNVRNSTTNFEFGIVEDLAQHIPEQNDTNKTLDLIEQFMNGFVLPIVSMSAQSRIMRKQEQTVWEEKKSMDRNVW